MANKMIEFADSLCVDNGKKYCDAALQYIKHSAEAQGKMFVVSEWTTKVVANTQQSNSTNCGVHVCINANLRDDNQPMVYPDGLGSRYRTSMAVALMNGGVPDEIRAVIVPPEPVPQLVGYNENKIGVPVTIETIPVCMQPSASVTVYV